jgi:hypothetical protein
MSTAPFSRADLRQIEEHGIDRHRAMAQFEAFRKPPPYLRLKRPCTVGDGVNEIPSNGHQALLSLHREATSQGRCLKFVPASGAATRMFKELLWFHIDARQMPHDDLLKRARSGDQRFSDFLSFMEELKRFAFFDDLQEVMAKAGMDLASLVKAHKYNEILEYLLTPRGLNYANLPKGLLKFHRYPQRDRTAFEEHLVEAAEYIRDAQDRYRLHFTISPEHREHFERLLMEVRPRYESTYGLRIEVSFSVQRPSTETIAASMDNQPFRLDEGRLLFRPSGHGAVIENLNALQGDIIFIKNIDNVVPDSLKAETYLWKKVLAGHLIRIQENIFSYARKLEEGILDADLLDEVSAFCQRELAICVPDSSANGPAEDLRHFLLDRLNRPLRVCGVVRNVGEPGGGPFWVEGADGSLSLQIVEKAQVDLGAADQEEIWSSATHFNPVDIVCGVLDHRGKPFDLRQYVDPNAYIITFKSQGGRALKALELPGLWNGAMAHWNTIFIEVPIETFNPVKTVYDLLRKQHRSV